MGERVIAWYCKTPAANDFRAQVTGTPGEFARVPGAAMQDVAVRATRALNLEFAGVDILEQADGRIFLLEANFPCYFFHAQEFGGIDVAGMMLDYLAAKAAAQK